MVTALFRLPNYPTAPRQKDIKERKENKENKLTKGKRFLKAVFAVVYVRNSITFAIIPVSFFPCLFYHQCSCDRKSTVAIPHLNKLISVYLKTEIGPN